MSRLNPFQAHPRNPNIRRSGESQQAFRQRRRSENQASRGGSTTMLWPSSHYGTYVRAAHGPLHPDMPRPRFRVN
jgi:hypothetical protein